MLKVRNLEAGYGALRVLKGISLHVDPGEIVAIIGSNGAGKTTLLSAIAGLLPPFSGEVVFKGKDIARVPTERVVQAGLSLVPEDRKLFPPMTVRDNLVLGAYARLRGSGGKARAAESLETVLQLFPRLAERQDQLAGTLSGGEQQMLAIGRSLMSEPDLVMLDEPSMGHAPRVIKDIFKAIADLRARGKTILVVEQNARAILRMADRGYVMETGSLILEGSSSDLLNNRDVQRAFLGKEYESIAE